MDIIDEMDTAMMKLEWAVECEALDEVKAQGMALYMMGAEQPEIDRLIDAVWRGEHHSWKRQSWDCRASKSSISVQILTTPRAA